MVHVALYEGEPSLEEKAEDSKLTKWPSQNKDGAYQGERAKGGWVLLFEGVLTDG